MAAFRIDNRTLLVHHVVIFQQAFTDTEVVFFYLLLCTFDRSWKSSCAQSFHLPGNRACPLRWRYGRRRTDASSRLPVTRRIQKNPGRPDVLHDHATGGLRRDSWRSVPMIAKPPAAFTSGLSDVGTTTGHVGGNGNCSAQTGKATISAFLSGVTSHSAPCVRSCAWSTSCSAFRRFLPK